MGYLYGPFDEIPYEHYRINPIGIAKSKYSQEKAPHSESQVIISLGGLILYIRVKV
jgi:hypothetical protein